MKSNEMYIRLDGMKYFAFHGVLPQEAVVGAEYTVNLRLKTDFTHGAHIVEVNPVFSIVEMTGMSDDITNLYDDLCAQNCVLQFVRSGRIAVSTSCFERVNEYLAHREERYKADKE